MDTVKTDVRLQVARAIGRQKAEAFHEEQLKAGEKYLRRVVYLAPSLFFILLLPKAIATYLAESTSVLQNSALAAEAGVGMTILALAWIHVKVSDPLRYGSTKEAKFFRANWPSKFIARALQAENPGTNSIDRIWFQFFRALAYPTSEYRPQVIWSYRRTYGARLVWLTTRVLILFVYLGMFVILLDIAIYLTAGEVPRLIPLLTQFLIILISTFALFLIKQNNKLPNKSSDEGTGCWQAVKRELGMQIDIFWLEIGKQTTLAKVREAVNNWEWSLAARMFVIDDDLLKNHKSQVEKEGQSPKGNDF